MNEYWGIISEVKNTELYKFLYAMPKGTMNHCHDGATYPWELYFELAATFPEVQIHPETHIFAISHDPLENHI